MNTSESDRRRKILVAVVLILIPLVLIQSINNISKANEYHNDVSNIIEMTKEAPVRLNAVVISMIESTYL